MPAPVAPPRRITLSQVSVVVGIVSAVVATGFLIADRLGGDPAGSPAPVRKLAVELSAVRATPQVSLATHLAATRRLDRFAAGSRNAGLAEGTRRALLRTPGVEVAYHVRIQGPPGRRVSLATTLFRRGSRRPLPADGLEQRTTYVSEAVTDELSDRVWVPAPARPGAYVAELDVLDERRESIANASTGAFRIR